MDGGNTLAGVLVGALLVVVVFVGLMFFTGQFDRKNTISIELPKITKN